MATEKTPPHDERAKGSAVARLLKWAGGVTALLSLVFAVQQLTQSMSENRERKRNTSELYRTGKLQQSAADYPAAWKSFESGLEAADAGGHLAKLTGQLNKERREFREAQEDLAMEWLETASINRDKGETFTAAVAPFTPVLTKGITNSSGSRQADLLAHFGWLNFLQTRDGNTRLKPDEQYRQALAVDSMNPYAHAYLGHWLLWTKNADALPEAREHFGAALRSGRAHTEVRAKQLSAFDNLGEDGQPDYLRAVADMRKSNDSIDARVRGNLYYIYWQLCRPRSSGFIGDSARFKTIRAAIPIEDHVAILQTVLSSLSPQQWRVRERDACRATFLETSGKREEALGVWRALRQSEASDAVWRAYADAALRRLVRE